MELETLQPEHETHGDSAPGYGRLVRQNPNFRYLWLGQIVSLFGDWFNLIASAALLAQLTESGVAVGGLFVVRMLAPFLVSPLAGVLADRFNRKHLLIAADVARTVIVFGFLLVRQSGDVWLLYVLTALQLAISGIFFPARNAILPDLVSDRELGVANTLSMTTWSVMLAVGAALGGLAAGVWGIYTSFALDGLTFLISALFLSRIVYRPESGIDEIAGVRHAIGQYVDGLRYLARRRDVLVVSLQKGVLGLAIAGAFNVVQVELAVSEFPIGEGGATSMGIMYALVGVGTGIAPIFVRRWTGDRQSSLRLAIVFAFGLSAVGNALPYWWRDFFPVMTGILIRSIGTGVVWVFSTQLLMQILPNHVRGRVFATEFAFFTLFSATSTALGGWALDATSIGPFGVFLAMAGMSLLGMVFWGAWNGLQKRTVQLESGS